MNYISGFYMDVLGTVFIGIYLDTDLKYGKILLSGAL